MQQFFVEKLEQPYLSTDQRNQCRKVLRMRANDEVRLVDQEGNGIKARFTDDSLETLEFIEKLEWKPRKRKLRLIASLIRSERLEWMIQKACECGVDEIILLRAEHGVVRDFGSRSNRKIERFNAIAQEACEQSLRQFSVKVRDVIDAKDVGSYVSDLNVFADVGENPHFINEIENAHQSVTVIIGSEGGYSNAERDIFKEQGFKPISMGTQIYRAETASIVACNIVEVAEVIK